MNKDRISAILLVLLGMGIILEGRQYGIGSLRGMGPGFFPVVLGVLLVLVGAAIGLTAPASTPSSEGAAIARSDPRLVDWRSWSCILGGVMGFILFGRTLGLAPATFAAVFISALGDRRNHLRDAALLASGLTIVGALIFHVGLHVQIPLFAWGS
jgi:Tripartite tricarboxylate transporter TctB family